MAVNVNIKPTTCDLAQFIIYHTCRPFPAGKLLL